MNKKEKFDKKIAQRAHNSGKVKRVEVVHFEMRMFGTTKGHDWSENESQCVNEKSEKDIEEDRKRSLK